jgi:hypothetical protein
LLLAQDLLYLDNLSAKSIEEKRELLVVELLTSKVETGDIPLDISIVATCRIDFLSITNKDVCKSVVEAGNTASRVDEVPTAILKAA